MDFDLIRTSATCNNAEFWSNADSLRIGSLFSGYGGLDMAVREALASIGITSEVVWHSDIKPAACALLKYRHPGVPNFGNLTRAFPVIGPISREAADLEPIDVLAASWPCQPHSPAGKRLGEADPRALWPNVARAVAETRPALFFGENVARIASNGELRRVVRALADLGYVGAWRCIRASDAPVFGCHPRARCFVVAVDPAAYPHGAELRHEPGWRGGAHGQSAGVPGHDGPERPLRLLKTPTANLASNGGSQHPAKRKAGGHGPTLADELEWLVPSPEWGDYAEAVARWDAALGRTPPSPTQPSPKAGGRPILSPAFVEWMMGLPSGHVTGVPGLTRNQMLSLLGDGVMPQQGAAAFRFLLGHLAERLASERAA